MRSLQRDLWKSSKALLFVFLISGSIARAQSIETHSLQDQLGLSGSLRGGFWNRDKSYSDQRNYAVSSAWFNVRPKEFLGFRFFLDAFVQAEDSTRDSFSTLDVREFYIERSWGDFDIKIGRAITVWGRADKLNPTDSLSVRDLTRLMTDDEDQRTGVSQLQLVYNWNLFRFTGLWIPEWRSPVYPLPPLSGITLKDQRPNDTEKQWALKIDQSGSSWDWSLSVFSGFNKLPDLQLISSAPSGSVIGFQYGKITTWGADFATTFGDYGWRGEVAYTKTEDDEGTNPLLQNSQVYAVLGVERSWFENLSMNVQFLHRTVLDYQSWESLPLGASRLLAQQTALNSNQVAENQSGLSVRPSYKMWNETLEVEVATVFWFHQTNGLARPKITYAVNDQWRWILGGEFYFGPEESFFGRLRPTSTGFMELRWLF